MNGTATETVASSWIEALGGVSMCWILSTPPDFWAHPGLAVMTMPAAKAAGMNHPVRIFMLFPPMRGANGHGVDCSTRGVLTHTDCIEGTVRGSGKIGKRERSYSDRGSLPARHHESGETPAVRIMKAGSRPTAANRGS